MTLVNRGEALLHAAQTLAVIFLNLKHYGRQKILSNQCCKIHKYVKQVFEVLLCGGVFLEPRNMRLCQRYRSPVAQSPNAVEAKEVY